MEDSTVEAPSLEKEIKTHQRVPQSNVVAGTISQQAGAVRVPVGSVGMPVGAGSYEISGDLHHVGQCRN